MKNSFLGLALIVLAETGSSFVPSTRTSWAGQSVKNHGNTAEVCYKSKWGTITCTSLLSTPLDGTTTADSGASRSERGEGTGRRPGGNPRSYTTPRNGEAGGSRGAGPPREGGPKRSYTSNPNSRRRNDDNNPNPNPYPNNRSGGGNKYSRGPPPAGGGGEGSAMGGGEGPAGGAGLPSLKLENPMKIRHIIAPPQPAREPRQNSERDGQGGGGGRGGPGGQRGGRGGPGGGGDGRPQQQRGGPPGAGGQRGGPPGAGGQRGGPPGGQQQRGGGRPGGPGVAAKSGDDDSSSSGGDSASRNDRKRRQGPVKRKDSPYAETEGKNDRKNQLRVGTGKKGRAASLTTRRGSLKKRDRTAEKERREEAALYRRTVELPEGPISVSDLADIIDEKPVALIKFLMTDLGVMASMTQNLDPATCVAVCEGFGRVIAGSEYDDEDDEDDDDYDDDSALATGFVVEEDDEADLEYRAPVVTIMGHVDHGKTSLLDAIRKTRVTQGEAGGITQHIAAYSVEHAGNAITFIDTPGHAAFTDMRERGANITDIVILVVAADDGVKQQTADSIACARQAGVPLIVAINKCDLETADPQRVRTELTTYDILTEDLGGEVLCCEISAKTGTNLDDLLDKIMLQAEVQDLKANRNRNAEAIVVEALVEKGLGTVATALVKKGTLRIGDIFVAGETYGRVRALISTNDGKTRLEEVGPSVPVRIVGFEGIPSAGDPLVVVRDEQTARSLAENRQRIAREKSSTSYQAGLMSSVTLSFGARKETREMCVVVKADVQGTAEALTRSLRELKLENEEAIVTIKVLVSQAGDVTKSDIAIAAVTPRTTVLAFNVAASYEAMESARSQGVPIEYYNIVYDAIDSVESRMQEVLSPTPDGVYSGSAKVQEVFNIGGTGNIAGSRCEDGMLRKGGNVRVMRGDKILIETKIKSLRNFKAETDMIEAGNDCGIGLVDFESFEPGDVIECYVV